MPSSRSSRTAPNRTFEDYILTLTTDSTSGLVNIPQQKLTQIPGGVGLSGSDDGYSDEIDIGFAFTFDGRDHKKFRVSPNGWLVLLDPANPVFQVTDFMNNTYNNAQINSTFIKNHVLLAVWFDDIISTYSNLSATGASANDVNRYEKGLAPPPPRNVNPRSFSVQYANDSSPDGRRLVVRWHSMSDYSRPNTSSQLIYEVVIYENGKIEYRYAPRNNLVFANVNKEESATVGIFMPNGTWRFRDFSYEVGYKPNRPRYRLGGATSGSWIDFDGIYNAPYALKMDPLNHWPAPGSWGATFTFQPPLNRKKVLPRLELQRRDSRLRLPAVARTGDSRTGTSLSTFDDRKSIVYRSSNAVVNYPTVLPRFYSPSIQGVVLNQGLFSGDFEVTRSLSKSAIEDFLDVEPTQYVQPFNDHNRPENDPSSNIDPFFLTGSAVTDVGDGFDQPLKSKTQIKLSFRVDHMTKMLEASSSIYYFNSRIGRWQYPTSSLSRDIGNPFTEADNRRLLEVDRGFNAFGFNLVSGSKNRTGSSSTTGGPIGEFWTRDRETLGLSNFFAKSVQNNQEYNANTDESFTLPIQQPFLIEKAVIELPFEAGPGWFNDRTRCFIPLSAYSPTSPSNITNSDLVFDIGGPGITVSLFNQLPIGPSTKRRDLILSGTITHDLDNVSQISISRTPNILAGASASWPGGGGGSFPAESGKIWQVTPTGFNVYGTPSCVITGSLVGASYFFTGSATMKCASEISNGTLIGDFIYIAHAYTGSGGGSSTANALNAITTLFSSSQWSTADKVDSVPNFLGTGGYRFRKIVAVNNFGRGGAGFQPSGRSILGKEYITTQGTDVRYYDNPLNLYKSSTSAADIQSRISLGTGSAGSIVYAYYVTSRQRSTPSPYLVLPGDRLILSVSKTRPVFFATRLSTTSGTTLSDPWTSGSIQHDVKLSTGSINITLYGSLVSNGREFHDTLNQTLASDAVHEVVVGGTNTW